MKTEKRDYIVDYFTRRSRIAVMMAQEEEEEEEMADAIVSQRLVCHQRTCAPHHRHALIN